MAWPARTIASTMRFATGLGRLPSEMPSGNTREYTHLMSDQDFTGDVFANVWESLVKTTKYHKKRRI